MKASEFRSEAMYNFTSTRLFKEHIDGTLLASRSLLEQATSTWALSATETVENVVATDFLGSGADILQRLPPELLRHSLGFLPYDTIAQIRPVSCSERGDGRCRPASTSTSSAVISSIRVSHSSVS